MKVPRLFNIRLDRAAGWSLPLAVLITLTAVRLSGWSWVEGIQLRAFDAFQSFHPRPYEDAGVRVIDIDEESLAKIGQWPWPRTVVAQLIKRLEQRGVAVIAFDAMFPEPDRTSPRNVASLWPDDAEFKAVRDRVMRLKDHDRILAERLRDSPVVLGFAPANGGTPPLLKASASVAFFVEMQKVGMTDDGDRVLQTNEDSEDYVPDFPGAAHNLPILEEAAAGLGSIGFVPEHDGIIRRAPLLFRFGDQISPSLALEALRVGMGTNRYRVNFGVNRDSTRFERLADGGTGIRSVRVGKTVIPTDGNGRLWVWYTRDRDQRSIPAWKVMDPKEKLEGVEGAVTFVGTSALGLMDLRATPLDPALDGVQIHANLAEQILLGQYLQRPGRATRVEVAVTLAAGLLLLLILQRAGAAWSAPIGLLMMAGAIGFSWYSYISWHWLFDPVFPVLALAGVYGAFIALGYIRSEQDRRRITDTFGRYLSPKVVHKLADNPGAVELGGETREMTFHFCDIRGFTTISEKLSPHELTVFINNFLTPMTQTILEHDGTIDKYMGDCIMAFWNAPMDVPDHTRLACRAALKMHAQLKELNVKWQAEAKAKGQTFPTVEIGTGLNTGSCVVGNMGSSLRVDYTVLGDDVNLASRLEGQSKTYGVRIVLGPLTRKKAPEFAAVELDLIKVKGKTEAVRIFALLGTEDDAQSPAFKDYAAGHDAMLEAYRAQRWDETDKRLKKLAPAAEGYGLSKLLHLYAERVAHFRAEPPGADWDGVFVATSK